jgi:hypothetical protein
VRYILIARRGGQKAAIDKLMTATAENGLQLTLIWLFLEAIPHFIEMHPFTGPGAKR